MMLPTILIVDDDRDVVQGLSLILRRGRRYDVVLAYSGDEALAVLSRKHVDLIISDQEMRGMEGTQLLATIARDWPHTQRIMLTARATLDVAKRAINDGKVLFLLEKPCRAEELQKCVSEAIAASSLAAATSRLLDIARSEGARLGAGASPSAKISPPMGGASVGAIDVEGLSSLSLREREVFDLLVDGIRISQVAQALFISKETVRNHVKAIFQKLDVHSQEELLAKSRGMR